ncbi:hypothetical protein ACQJBY_006013 [Aegilops geniculata]
MRRKFCKSLSYTGELAGRAVASSSSPSASLASLVGPVDDDEPFCDKEEGPIKLKQFDAKRVNNVLILMSDTSGGHCASSKAIKDAFRIELGDDCRVFVKDLCEDHAGWPLNNMESSYKFMVKHMQLWKVAFHGTSPKIFHNFYLAALASFYSNRERVQSRGGGGV